MSSSKGEDNDALTLLKKMLRRGRKYKMSVVLVSQEPEVEALGIKGQGNLRNAFTIIYLGGLAFKQLDNVRDKEHREKLRAILSSQVRPCLVESNGSYLPAAIPDLTVFAASLEDYTQPAQESHRQPQDSSDTFSPSQDSTGLYQDSIEGFESIEDSKEYDSTDDSTDRPAQSKVINQAESLVIPDTEWELDNSGVLEMVNGDDIPTLQARWQHGWVQQQLNEGRSKTKILKESLGLKGRAYSGRGKELWEKLQQRFGEFE